MSLKTFWDSAERHVVDTAELTALMTAAFLGMVGLLLPGVIKTRFWLSLAIVLGISALAGLLAGFMAALRFWRKKRVPYDLVMDDSDNLKPCPRCGGILAQVISRNLFSTTDPTCRICRTRYRPRKKHFFKSEFDVVPPAA